MIQIKRREEDITEFPSLVDFTPLDALRELKYYIDVQRPGTVRVCGQDVRELMGFRMCEHLIGLVEKALKDAQLSEAPDPIPPPTL